MTPIFTPESLKHSPSMCFDIADSLWFSSEVVQKEAQKANPAYYRAINARMKLDHLNEGKPESEWSEDFKVAVQKVKELEIKSNSARVAAMLRAFSIENELKGGYYALELAKHGHVSKVSSMETHDLIKLASYAKFKISHQDKVILESLTSMSQLGRYQIAHQGKGADRKHQVNFFFSPDRETDLRNRIRSHCRHQWAKRKASSP